MRLIYCAVSHAPCSVCPVMYNKTELPLRSCFSWVSSKSLVLGQISPFEILTEIGSWGTNYQLLLVWEKALQRRVVKSGTRKNDEVLVFSAEMLMTKILLNFSHHLFTSLIYIHFGIRLELFVDRWRLKEFWYPQKIFCLNVFLVWPLLLREKQEAGVKHLPRQAFVKTLNSTHMRTAL